MTATERPKRPKRPIKPNRARAGRGKPPPGSDCDFYADGYAARLAGDDRKAYVARVGMRRDYRLLWLHGWRDADREVRDMSPDYVAETLRQVRERRKS